LKHKTFFDNFQNTTDKNIDELLKKYNLVLNTSDIFIPEFPTEAISVMKEYTEIMKKVCEKKPIFYVIASADMFNKTYEKRDPILLVQSPFGFYWQILGAWDKEMLILNEL
jgi:predicted MPP superfamily phosphohydrolase